MARKPTDPQPSTKSKDPIGAYRVHGDRFAAYDAEGRTKIISEADAHAIGIRVI